MQKHLLTLPLSAEKTAALHSGDQVLLSGVIYTARDAAHQRLIACLQAGEPLPFDLRDAVIYYAGPSPTPPGKIIGAIGPTTSGRMDAYTPQLLAAGLRGMIGKGRRGDEVRQAIQKHKAIYFAALGGAAALLARCVRAAELIAWPELGAEAVYRLTVEDMPLVVINDIYGQDIYNGLPLKTSLEQMSKDEEQEHRAVWLEKLNASIVLSANEELPDVPRSAIMRESVDLTD